MTDIGAALIIVGMAVPMITLAYTARRARRREDKWFRYYMDYRNLVVDKGSKGLSADEWWDERVQLDCQHLGVQMHRGDDGRLHTDGSRVQ